MKAGPTAPRDGAEKRIARGVPSRMLADRAVELARGLAALERRTPPGTPAPESGGGRRARAADAGRAQRGAGAVVAAVRRHLRLRRAARRAVPVAGAVGAGSSAACSSARGRARSATSSATPWRDEQARWMARDRPRAAAAAGTRCWSSATVSSTGAPRTRPTASPPRARRSAWSRSRARRRRGPLHDRRLAEIFAEQPAPRAPAAAAEDARQRSALARSARRTGRCRS